MDALWLDVDGETLALHGAAAGAPWREAVRLEQSAGDEVESFQLRLEGRRAEVLDALDTLERLAHAVNEPSPAGGHWLWLKPSLNEAPWCRCLTHLHLATAVDARSPYRALVRLRAQTCGDWLGEAQPLPLSNRAAPEATVEPLSLTLLDAAPAGAGCNWVEFAAPVGCGSAGLRVEVCNSGDTPVGQIWLGLRRCIPAAGLPVNRLEAEAGQGGVLVSAASAAGGWARRVTAATAAESDLLTLPLAPDLAAWVGMGRPLRVLLRLAQPAGEGHIMLRARLVNAAGEAQAIGRALWPGETDQPAVLGLRDLGTLLPLGGSSLVVSGRAVDGAAADVMLDYAELAPADGFRRLVAPGGVGLLPGERLIDDPVTDAVDASDAAGVWRAYGDTLRLTPGARHRLYVYAQGGGAHQADIARAITLRLTACPQREWFA